MMDDDETQQKTALFERARDAVRGVIRESEHSVWDRIVFGSWLVADELETVSAERRNAAVHAAADLALRHAAMMCEAAVAAGVMPAGTLFYAVGQQLVAGAQEDKPARDAN